MENTPTSKIRSLAMGFVEIKGKAKPFENMSFIGPVSQIPCVYYQYLVEEYRRRGKSSRWVKLHEGDCGYSFFLEDETGKVMINPVKCKIDVTGIKTYQKGLFTKDPEHIENFYKENFIPVKSRFFGKRKLRLTERRIELDDELYILGNACKNEYYQENTRNEAGIVIKKSWKVPFQISDKSEKDLTDTYSTWAILSLIGGVVLLTGFVAMLLNAMNII